ncbi:tautomerase family protein [Dyella marensis]|jgi:malonate semialdehyde decarboxylase|uniref:Tautomerase enzyme n=1 Tax=Dyella marensis TaxID=500610 RepID=A0A1I2DWG0_9GAMM|nr:MULTISPECIES: tautomerase family protein [Dyella]SFE85002.1 Tautomerase enzyme [Dyella marensis]
MPLIKFDVIAGRNDQELRALMDATHEAMVEAFEVPATDRYQSVTQHRPAEMVLEDTGLGFRRSEQAVVLTVVSRRRTEAQKQTFYRLLAERLHDRCGLSPDDLIVSLVENGDADWSFGHGRAQFLTKEL